VKTIPRLAELAEIAAEQVMDILSQDMQELVGAIQVVRCGPVAGQPDDVLQVEWLIEYGEEFSQPVSMYVLSEHLDDEEALVLSFSAWLLQAISGEDDPKA
jgi:hypothetical protein